MIALVLSVMVLVGCQSTSNDNEQENNVTDLNEQEEENTETSTVADEAKNETEVDDVEPLTLHMLPADEEAGFTVENSEFYEGIQNVIDENPTAGADDDFTLRTIDILNSNDGQSKLMALGINRLDVSLTNITFNLTLGNQNGNNILENEEVMLTEEQIGILEPNHAVPILFILSDEEVDQLLSLQEGDLQVIIEDFDAETVE